MLPVLSFVWHICIVIFRQYFHKFCGDRLNTDLNKCYHLLHTFHIDRYNFQNERKMLAKSQISVHTHISFQNWHMSQLVDGVPTSRQVITETNEALLFIFIRKGAGRWAFQIIKHGFLPWFLEVGHVVVAASLSCFSFTLHLRGLLSGFFFLSELSFFYFSSPSFLI